MNSIKEKAATQMLSVGADNEQPLIKNLDTSLADTASEINMKLVSEAEIDMEDFNQISSMDYLHTISHTELLDTAFQPRVQIISGLLNAGTYLFAGAPKVGKSFFMAQLGFHVSSGIPLWEYPVNKGTVLYLALEDNYSRLQKRLSRMYGMDCVDNFHFATQAKNLNDGLNTQLIKFVAKHQDTRLIIIDTLQKIRELSGDNYSYASDYDIVTRLKKFSDEYNICVIVVHHTRKQFAEDCFDTISGTNGLLGAADGAFIMQKAKRTDNIAILDIVGRDQQDQRLHMEFDREHCVWGLLQAETELWKEPVDLVLETIFSFLSSAGNTWKGTASELVECLSLEDTQPNVLSRKINVSSDRLWNEYGVRVNNKRTRQGRIIELWKTDG